VKRALLYVDGYKVGGGNALSAQSSGDQQQGKKGEQMRHAQFPVDPASSAESRGYRAINIIRAERNTLNCSNFGGISVQSYRDSREVEAVMSPTMALQSALFAVSLARHFGPLLLGQQLTVVRTTPHPKLRLV
jgi:hypothetical protein